MKRPRDLICLSHLRWNFVFQRPNHLMNQCSRERRVFFVEEPTWSESETGLDSPDVALSVQELGPRLFVVTPRLRAGSDAVAGQRAMLQRLQLRFAIEEPILWFYTPMALEFARDLRAAFVVYDCMDELSAFRGAPPALRELERELFTRADLVFTGGQSLFESKRALHPRTHLFPSSVDVEHFRAARSVLPEPPDQAVLPRPRAGFFGVLDERLDLELLARVARERPECSLVMVGPVVKIDPATLPRAPNLHYLGQKSYDELPAYLSGWQAAMMPFALNESTRFISPTKTLEYLAGGKPVVSTPIRDVVSPYAERGLVQVATGVDFAPAVARALVGKALPDLSEIDAFLAQTSWQRTWMKMSALMARAQDSKKSRGMARRGTPQSTSRAEEESGVKKAASPR